MKAKRNMKTAAWVVAYLALALAPLAVVLWSEPMPSRGFWIEFSVALGFIALAMFGLQFVLTARSRRIGAPHGLDTILQFHREAGLVAVAFALLHPAIILVSAPYYLEYLDPRVDAIRAVVLIAVLIAMVLVVVLTIRRERLGIRYEWWRLSHGILGLFIVAVGLVHILQVQWYVVTTWQRALWIGLTGGPLMLLLYARMIKPLRIRRRPYRVLEVRLEGRRTWTLALEPVGHRGVAFAPGQFAWLTIGRNSFSLQQHPFSFSSSAARHDRIEFTIRELGDFTETIGDIEPGTPGFVDGPYGTFVPDLSSQRRLVLIGGGVGIAPLMSMLRTLRDRQDRRPVLLVYACREAEELVFRTEIDALSAALDFRAVYVLEQPGPDVRAEQGLLRAELMDKLVAGLDIAGAEFFVCGPPRMMDTVEKYLIDRGVRGSDIHSERFDIA